MAKKSNPQFKVDDFFGTQNDYYVFGVQSGKSLFRLAADLGNLFDCDFFYLEQYTVKENPDLNYHLMYAPISESKEIHCFLMENKTTHDSQFYVAETEKKLSFHTMNLFEDDFFILNKKGLRLFTWPFLNADFLMLFYTEKDRNITSFFEKIQSLPRLKLVQDFDIMKYKQSSPHIKRRKFFQNLFCEIEIKSRNFMKQRLETIFHLSMDDHRENTQFSLNDNLLRPLNLEYINYLVADPSEEVEEKH